MMVKDEWMRAAMTDDTLVVELLVRLKQSQAASTPLKSQPQHPSPQPPSMLPLTWSVRLPRSRALRCDGGGNVSQRKQSDSTRCSPTTPLSWSGGTASPSATADGFEESSQTNNRSPSHSRSKGTAANNELGSNTSTSRRSRRKKTFNELKEEEKLLIEESVYLKKELENLRATFKEQTSTNKSLKRIKLELGVPSAKYVNADGPKRPTSSQPHQRVASSFETVHSNMPTETSHHVNPKSDSSNASKAVSNRDGFFMLPDLNSLPSEEDSGFEMLYGMS